MEPLQQTKVFEEPVEVACEHEKKTIADYKSIVYKTSNSMCGSTAHMIQPKGPFNRSAKFSNHLARAGNFANNGLQTVVMADRNLDQSKDWMAKNN